MKRIIALAVTFLFVVTMAAQAQTRPETSQEQTRAATTPSASVFSKASIDKAAASIAASSPMVPSSGKPIYKHAWPYVVAAVIIALIVIF